MVSLMVMNNIVESIKKITQQLQDYQQIHIFLQQFHLP